MQIFRLMTGIFGGYILSSLITISLTLILPFSNKVESVILASMLSFSLWLIFILYSYSNISLKMLITQFSIISIALFLLNTYISQMKVL